MRLYRAVARAFFVPAALAPPPDAQLAADLQAALADARQGDDGGVFYFLDQGRPAVRRVPARKGPPALDVWRMMTLSEADARDLAAEIEQLLARFSGRTRGKGYLVHAALAPRSLAGPARGR